MRTGALHARGADRGEEGHAQTQFTTPVPAPSAAVAAGGFAVSRARAQALFPNPPRRVHALGGVSETGMGSG